MRFAFACLLFHVSLLPGQTLTRPSRIPADVKALFEENDARDAVNCKVSPTKPILNYGFRFYAGYTADVPLKQYAGEGHKWTVILKVTPEDSDREPAYLVSRVALPPIAETKSQAEFGGGYLIGEGRYRVQWMLLDEMGRTCRKDWTVKASLGRGEQNVKLAIPPYMVTDISLRNLRARPRETQTRPSRITVLMHAAPLFPRRVTMRSSDSFLLLGSLFSLLEQLNPRSVRLVAFNLSQQEEILRDASFGTEKLSRLAASFNQLELGTVSLDVLHNPRGHISLLSDLVQSELSSHDVDAVIFMGPPSRFGDSIPQEEIDKLQERTPRFFYFKFLPFGPLRASLPDTIQVLVGKLKGKTINIYSPRDLANAIAQLEAAIGGAG